MSSINALFLSEEKVAQHLRGFRSVQSLVQRALNVLGYLEPFADGDWTIERADARLSQREPLPRRPLQILRAACHVARSAVGLEGSREVVIDVVASMMDPLLVLIEGLGAHKDLRVSEVEAERFFDFAAGVDTVFTDAHNASVAAQVDEALALGNKLKEALVRLAYDLQQERPAGFERAYNESAAGTEVEFPARLQLEGLKYTTIASLLGLVPRVKKKTASKLELKIYEGKLREQAKLLNGRCYPIKRAIQEASRGRVSDCF